MAFTCLTQHSQKMLFSTGFVRVCHFWKACRFKVYMLVQRKGICLFIQMNFQQKCGKKISTLHCDTHANVEYRKRQKIVKILNQIDKIMIHD